MSAKRERGEADPNRGLSFLHCLQPELNAKGAEEERLARSIPPCSRFSLTASETLALQVVYLCAQVRFVLKDAPQTHPVSWRLIHEIQ